MALVGQHSRVTVQCYPCSVVIDFAVLPAHRFWQETVSLLEVMCPQSNQWECKLLGRNFQLQEVSLFHIIYCWMIICSCLQSLIPILLKPKKLWQKVFHGNPLEVLDRALFFKWLPISPPTHAFLGELSFRPSPQTPAQPRTTFLSHCFIRSIGNVSLKYYTLFFALRLGLSKCRAQKVEFSIKDPQT